MRRIPVGEGVFLVVGPTPLKRWAATFVVVCAVLTALAAQAQSGNTDAKDYYRKGTAAYNLGHYREAAQAYERAYELTLDSALLFNVAQAHRLSGERQKAIVAYRSYLRTEPEGGKRAIAEAKLKELEAALNYEDPFTEGGPKPTSSPPKAVPPPAPLSPPAAMQNRRSTLQLEPSPVAARPSATLTTDEGPAEPRERSFYARWPFWAATGGVAAVILVIVFVASTGSAASPQTDLGTMRF